MGGVACRPECESGCTSFCHTDDLAQRADLRHVENLSSLPLEERQAAAAAAQRPHRPQQQSAQGPSPAWDSATGPEANLELDLEELQSCQFGPPLPEGTHSSITFRSGSVYSGQWRGHSRHGFGYQTWPDGSSYTGQWADNAACGLGIFTYRDGSAYVGQWQRNRFHGLGAYYDASKTVYRGEWHNGDRLGHGVEESGAWPGTTFAGRFQGGLKEGPGVCSWTDGGEYAGQWRTNQITGCGTYACSERRRRYKGQWLDSQKHGTGHYEWPDGRVYKGQYSQDQASGFGAFSWPDGQRYEGYWQYGKQHGAGQYTASEGEVRQLMWFEGRPQAETC
mmetsp:Transcript_71723/g.180973  ORF Transcript_71723/g.180973 Transcript_71723/m.180973 type:complete len:335 (-) Transcript_71723:93-1097(-)